MIKERSPNPEYDTSVMVIKIISTNITLNALVIGVLFISRGPFTNPIRKTRGPEIAHTMASAISSLNTLVSISSMRKAKTTPAIIKETSLGNFAIN
ncbi:MAG: hypothetical protein M1593_02270, partial [Candidatus Thermoplasmatota archaeon]|nr:hypothetical protein [Candidatus Thermoplasmatota archaeon]